MLYHASEANNEEYEKERNLALSKIIRASSTLQDQVGALGQGLVELKWTLEDKSVKYMENVTDVF